MLSVSLDAFMAGVVPFFFISYGVIWFAYTIYDVFKKK